MPTRVSTTPAHDILWFSVTHWATCHADVRLVRRVDHLDVHCDICRKGLSFHGDTAMVAQVMEYLTRHEALYHLDQNEPP